MFGISGAIFVKRIQGLQPIMSGAPSFLSDLIIASWPRFSERIYRVDGQPATAVAVTAGKMNDSQNHNKKYYIN